jgi:hypothetical protein
MFKIDLLKGSGLPEKLNLGKLAVRGLSLAVPVLMAIFIFGMYTRNNVLLAAGERKLAGIEKNIEQMRDDVSFYRQTDTAINEAKKYNKELEQAMQQVVQWSPITETIAKALPNTLVLYELEVSRTAITEKIPDPDDTNKKIDIEYARRILNITLVSFSSLGNDPAVRKYIDKLEQSEAFTPYLEDIRLVSRTEEKVDDKTAVTYVIQCTFKVRKLK